MKDTTKKVLSIILIQGMFFLIFVKAKDYLNVMQAGYLALACLLFVCMIFMLFPKKSSEIIESLQVTKE